MPFAIQSDQFSGPLDLLLSLIQERKLYINEISLAQVTDAYLSYLEQYQEHPVEETAQFVYIASTLLLIKSRSLLPDMQLTEDEQSDIAELERRLRQYRIYHQAALKLRKQWHEAPLIPSGYKVPIQAQFAPGNTTLEAISHTANRLVHTLPTKEFRPEVKVAPTMTLEQAVDALRTRIRSTTRLLFSEIKRGGNKTDIIVHFLALLELVKGGIVAAEQEGTFHDIVVNTDAVETPQY